MRLLHTMLRVGDLERSLHFYTDILGMTLLRRRDYPDVSAPGKGFTLAFVGFAPESDTAVIELTHNWGVASYELGTAFGHLAIGVEDVYVAAERIRAAGGKIVREPGPMKGGSTILAFVEDPDGYRIELLPVQRKNG